jgi:hypothetical protein
MVESFLLLAISVVQSLPLQTPPWNHNPSAASDNTQLEWKEKDTILSDPLDIPQLWVKPQDVEIISWVEFKCKGKVSVLDWNEKTVIW